MADKTHIEWTDATWNPITGCDVVSPGCTNCYAMKLAGGRLKHHWSRKGLTVASRSGPVWNGEVRFNEVWLEQPMRWTKPRMIFVCAHGDLFHEDVPDEWIDRVFAVMALCPQHTFQVLTKRPERMHKYLMRDVALFAGQPIGRFERVRGMMLSGWGEMTRSPDHLHGNQGMPWPLPNVWLGVSCENDLWANRRIGWLLDTDAAVRFVSLEPLLGPITLDCMTFPKWPHAVGFEDGFPGTYDALGGTWWPALGDADEEWEHRIEDLPKIDWVIVGGESGPGARPMHPDWARSLRDQCANYHTDFHFKQWGEFSPTSLKTGVVRRKRGFYMRKDGSNALGTDAKAIEDMTSKELHYQLNHPDVAYMAALGKKASGRLLDGREWNGTPETA